MPTLAEALRALEGSLAIARSDPDPSRFFDLSADSFWRSFGAVIFMLPIYLFITLAEARMAVEITEPGTPQPDTGTLMFAETIILGLDWVAYPAAVFFLAPLLGLTKRFAPYIIVYNWSSLALILVLLPNYLLYSIGLFPVEAAVMVNFILLIAFFWFRFKIAREVLDAEVPTAIGMVALDTVLGLFIGLSVTSIMIGQVAA